MRIYHLCIIGVISLCFFSCGSDEGTDSSEKPKFFRYNQLSGVNSLDPAFAKDQGSIWATHQIYDGLVQVDKDLNVVPNIAERWEISSDGLIYTFHLKDNVSFHPHETLSEDTKYVNAQDVVYSFDRILDKKVASPGAWIFNDRLDENNPFTAVDEKTFQLKLRKPFPPMLGILTMPYCYIVAEEVVSKYGKEYRNNPVGTGPFKFKFWKENEVLVYEKNPEYHEAGLPHLDGVRITFMENKKSEWLKLKEGELDFVSGLDATYKDEALTSDGALKESVSELMYLQKSPYLNSEYLGILQDGNTNSALQNKLIRQAINYGFDRKRMMTFLRNGIGKPADAGFIPAGLPSYDSNKVKGYSYDPQKAQALLEEAGFPGGRGLSEIKLLTNPTYQDLSTFIQNQLQDIGIPVKLEINQPSFLREMMVKGKADFFRGSWIADYPDGENFLTVLYGQNPAPPNYTRFKNAEFDKLYEASFLENDLEKRNALYQACDRILIEEAPIVPLFYDEVTRFIRKGITGLENNAQNLLILKSVKKEN